MWEIGTRVAAGSRKGSVVELTPELEANFPGIAGRSGGFFCIEFDEPDANGFKHGVYSHITMMVRRLPTKRSI